MMAEFAKNRIAKIKNDYSKYDLNHKLGLINNNSDKTSEEIVNWFNIK